MGPAIAAIGEGLAALLESGAVQSATLDKLGAKFGKVDALLGVGGSPGSKLDDTQKEALGKWTDRLGAIGDKIGSVGTGIANFAAGQQPLLTKLGGAASSAGETAMKYGGPAGLLVGGLAQGIGTLASAVEKLQDWNHMLNQSDLQFAQFSSSMAGVKANQDYNEQRSMTERGEKRADSAAAFSEKSSRLDRQLGQLEDWFTSSAEKYVAGPLTEITSWAIEKTTGATGEIENKTDTSIEQWMGGWLGQTPEEAMKEIQSRRPKNMGGGQ